MDRRRLLLSLLLLWFMAIVIVFFVAGERSAAIFAFLYAIVYGGICYRYRAHVKSLLKHMPVPAAILFFGLAFVVAAAEEVFCYLTDNRITLAEVPLC